MNSTYPQQASSPHQLGFRQNSHDASYRGPPPGAPQYPMPPHAISQTPSANPQYGDPYNPLVAARATVPPEGLHAEGLAPLAPGIQPLAPPPSPRSRIEKGWKYELSVVQQPRRARMCGFGDKDRRPITPPPCVRLIITDMETGKEVDVNEIEHGMFVLNVDLWNAEGSKEVTLVRHSATSPSISSTTPVSYGTVDSTVAYSSIIPSGGVKYEGASAGYSYPNQPQVASFAGGQPPQAYAQAPYQSYPPPTNGQHYPPQNGYSQPPVQPVYYTSGAAIHAQGPPQGIEFNQQMSPHGPYGGQRPFTPADQGAQRMPGTSTPQGMFTRNLIGSLAASAFRLTDPDDKIGIWFVLQDLSVRTEGTFRLRFSFVNVGETAQSPTTPSHSSSSGAVTMTSVNRGKAPVLASCFSEVFTVYSAKRFPGVVESTHLSKCFATQGIKIPIRKDGPGKGKDGDDDYD